MQNNKECTTMWNGPEHFSDVTPSFKEGGEGGPWHTTILMILPRIQGGQGVGERRGVWKEKKMGWRIGRGREGNGSCVHVMQAKLFGYQLP